MNTNQQPANPAIPDATKDELLEEVKRAQANFGEGAEKPAESAPPVVEVEEVEEVAEDAEEGGEDLEALPYPPGLVGETAEWIYERSPKPFRPFATLGALAVWSVLAGRKVRYQNQGTILYCLCVAASSNGKEEVQTLAREILGQVGVSPLHVAGRFSSWNAAHEKLTTCWFHAVVISLDPEASGYLGAAIGAEFGLLDLMKAAWSKAEGTLDPQGRVKRSGSVDLSTIHRPSLSMLLTAQPSTLGKAVGTAQLEDGLLPRALFAVRRRFCVDLEEENLSRSRRLMDSDTGQLILHKGKNLWDWLWDGDAQTFGDMAGLEAARNPEPEGKRRRADEEEGDAGPMRREVWMSAKPFDADAGAQAIFRDFSRRMQERIRPAAEGRAGPIGYLWGKAGENAKRVALTLAAARCGGTAGPYTIQEAEAAWAVRFVEAATLDGIRWARENMADTPFQQQVNRVAGFVRNAPSGIITHRDLNRKLRNGLKPMELAEAVNSLKESGLLEVVEIHTKGRTATGYRWKESRK